MALQGGVFTPLHPDNYQTYHVITYAPEKHTQLALPETWYVIYNVCDTYAGCSTLCKDAYNCKKKKPAKQFVDHLTQECEVANVHAEFPLFPYLYEELTACCNCSKY